MLYVTAEEVRVVNKGANSKSHLRKVGEGRANGTVESRMSLFRTSPLAFQFSAVAVRQL